MKQIKLFFNDAMRQLRNDYKAYNVRRDKARRTKRKPTKNPRLEKVFELKALLVYYQWSIMLLLITSGIQIAIAFQRGSFSIAAWLKAAAIEFSIGLLNKSIGHSKILKLPTSFLWLVLVVLMVISVFANLNYEYGKILALKRMHPPLSGKNIMLWCDAWDHASAWLYSTPIPFLILGMVKAYQNKMNGVQLYEGQEVDGMSKKAKGKAVYAARKLREAQNKKDLGIE